MNLSNEIIRTSGEGDAKDGDFVMSVRNGRIFLANRSNLPTNEQTTYITTVFNDWTDTDYSILSPIITPSSGALQFSVTLEHTIPANTTSKIIVAKNGTIAQILLSTKNLTASPEDEVNQAIYSDKSNSTDFYQFIYLLYPLGTKLLTKSTVNLLRVF